MMTSPLHTRRQILRTTLGLGLASVLRPRLGQAQQPALVTFQDQPYRSDLVAWWRVMPGTTGGNVWRDLSPYATHATLTNMGIGAPSGWSPTARRGGDGQMNFDGANDYADLGTCPPVLNLTAAMTLMAWIWNRAPSGCCRQFVLSSSSGVGGYSFGVIAQQMCIELQGPGVQYLAAPVNNPPGQIWIHLAATYETATTSVNFYQNGQLRETVAAATAPQSNSGALVLGAMPGGSVGQWDGALDDIRIYKRALTPLEIEDVYRRSAGTEAGSWARAASPLLVPPGGNPGAFFPFFPR